MTKETLDAAIEDAPRIVVIGGELLHYGAEKLDAYANATLVHVEVAHVQIMLLAYYVAAVNIETTYNALQAERAQRNGEPEPEYVPFDGIALADTFQIHHLLIRVIR